MEYLDQEQFSKFFKCASDKTLSPDDPIDKSKYVDTRNETLMEYPEALFQFVMGKHLPL